MRTRPGLLVGLATTSLLLVACGSAQESVDPEPAGPEAASRPSGPTSTDDRGWLDGEPGWEDGLDSDAGSGADAGRAYGLAADGEELTDDSRRPDTSEGVTGPLRAGSVDDNADYAGYLDYLQRVAALGLPLRPFDARGRIVVTVEGSDGRPAAGEEVIVLAGDEEVASLRTTADGTARFLPATAGQPVDGSFTMRTGDDVAPARAGEAVELTADRPGGVEGAVPLDVLFLLDATGSMGDEIDQLKTSIDSVAARVEALDGAPDVRFAMTLYRDQHDAFVTSTFDFTSDVAEFRQALAAVRAGGGNDYPEALEEGLAEALAEPSWRPAGEAVQLVFLVADAPPHTTRELEVTYPDAARDAVARGIKIFPVASSESDDLAEAVFRQLAQATGARFVFLSYGAGGAATGKSSDIDASDYEELSLDDLIVRLTAEELAALTGDGAVVPPPTQSPEPTPSGQ